MARNNNPGRVGSGANNLDTLGRVNKFSKGNSDRAAKNAWRRKSNGGSGG